MNNSYTKSKLFFPILFALLIIFLFFLFSFRINSRNIESNARENQHISPNWTGITSNTDKLGAVLFFESSNLEKCIYSIYMKRTPFSFGYSFASGGERDEIKNGLCEFVINDYGSVFFSLNNIGIQKIEITNGINSETYDFHAEPICLVLPPDYGEIRIYNMAGEEITTWNIIEESY